MKHKGISIKDYLLRDIKESTKDVLNFLINKGYTLDYTPSYGVITFGHLFLDYNLNVNDFIFISNKYSKIMSKADSHYPCMDNFRFANKYKDKEYETRKALGCCGFFDECYYNPITKSKLYLGFNYGH